MNDAATAEDRIVILCRRLADATAARGAEWRVDGADTFLWERAEGSVAIRSRDGDGEPPFELAVYNPAGQKVEERTSALVDDDRPAPWNEALADLYRLARRSGLRADDIVDALIEQVPQAGIPAA
jgi:hypothetical protein